MPFGLFKRKESEPPAELPAIAAPAAGALSIPQTQDLLRSIESARVQELAARLAPVKESAAQSLRIIGALANEMEHEKIKLEGIEQRYKSVAENAKRTVVSTLKREASTELVLPQSANDAKKFKERFEAMMNRFGEVSGSHSKVLNAFMKKHASKMKDEFEALTKLLNETRGAMSDFEQKRAPIVKCGGILNTASQKASSIRSAESSVQNIENEIARIGGELEGLKSELGELRASPEFGQAQAAAQKAGEAEMHEEQFHLQLTDLFSHVSRAFTKYSYGLTKETEARLQMMSDEPWKMFGDELPEYSELLKEISKSVSSGQIQLKDADKILQNLDSIYSSLPKWNETVRSITSEISELAQQDMQAARRVSDLEESIAILQDEIDRNRQELDIKKRQIVEKSAEVDSLLLQVSESLAELTGRRYKITR